MNRLFVCAVCRTSVRAVTKPKCVQCGRPMQVAKESKATAKESR